MGPPATIRIFLYLKLDIFYEKWGFTSSSEIGAKVEVLGGSWLLASVPHRVLLGRSVGFLWLSSLVCCTSGLRIGGS